MTRRYFPGDLSEADFPGELTSAPPEYEIVGWYSPTRGVIKSFYPTRELVEEQYPDDEIAALYTTSDHRSSRSEPRVGS